MSSRTVKRKSPNARQVAGTQAKARRVRSAKNKSQSMLSEILAWIPLNEAQWHRVLMVTILGGALMLAAVVASAAGVPALASQQFAAIAVRSGFEVRRVEVRGVKRLNELKVYERALAQRNRAMPLVDVDGLRNDLLELSWVADARVSRQLPETLVIDIVERTPHAVLRLRDKLVLIDETGHPLEPISSERARGKLILSGANADKQVAVLSALLGAAPALKPQIREAEWLGNRRWNLTLKTGQVLALPEGNRPMANALVEFARLDGTNRLIGGRVTAFDMRTPGRIYLRIPGRAEEAQSGAVKPSSDKPGVAKSAAEKSDTAKSGPTKFAERAAQSGDKN
ncbi:MAG: cell division protein FtsQ/DivIB [Novosphingobium sp.]